MLDNLKASQQIQKIHIGGGGVVRTVNWDHKVGNVC